MYKLSIALRYLLRRRIAYIAIVAITFGVAIMILVMSIMDGFQERIRNSIQNIDSGLTVWAANPHQRNDPGHFDIVRSALEPHRVEKGGEIVGLSKRVDRLAFVTTRARGPYSTSDGLRQRAGKLIGIDPVQERRLTPLDDMLDGVRDAARRVPDDQRDDLFTYKNPKTGLPARDPGILLGIDLARRLFVGRGDLVTIITAKEDLTDGLNNLDAVQKVEDRFRVVGCFQTGRYDYDSQLALCEGRVLQDMLDFPSDCATVQVKIRDPDRADEVKADLVEKLGSGFVVESWKDHVRTYVEALDVEKAVMLIILFCIIIVAGACISGILYMMVLEKTRDIGILMSMGATSPGVTFLFLGYGAVLGIIGSTLGTGLGLLLVEELDAILEGLRSIGIDVWPRDVYQFETIPTKVDPAQITLLAVVAIAASLFAAVLPAFRASRLDPVKCLAYE